uniref:OSJNBb0093G06.1 protein n=1 Tax=Oryza sativa subsp. japonica TaxID=39947 RepID=Q7X7D9_ORYSJ|nr:OSJNBb0093G06.1 [Oryza sativa Japonica Group]
MGSGKIRVCINFRDLNKATPKDEYPMPIANMMINDASGHKVISFLDGNAGYNQIFMAEKDMYKTAFRCPGFVGIILEIYIDDIVVKSDGIEGHMADLRLAFERMRRYGLKMNQLKCAFGVSAGKFLGFMVHERGVEINPKKIEKIRDFKAPICKKEVQKLLGKKPILLGGAKQQEAFEELKRYLSTQPVVRAPKAGKPFRLYIASEDKVIGAVLTQEEDGKEYIITYLSRRLLDAETRSCIVACQADVIKHMLQRPILSVRIGKWAYALIEYDLAYEPLKSMKGQIEIEEDWRIPLIRYLKDPTLKVDRKIRRQAFKYTLLDEDLYRRNIDGDLLKCLDEVQSKVAMGEGHRFVLVATDYFTKWAEAVPLKNMTHTEANGQAESSNKTLLKLVKKKIEEHPKRWHEVISEALWAHRISKHGAIKVTPFELVYGQEAVLPVEVNLGSLRYIKQDDLSSEDYKTLMGDNLDEVIDKRLKALEEIEKEKKRVAKAYNKRVKAKLFQVGDLVWKTILPLGTRSREFGKWSPSWEGPYRVCGIVRGNTYFLETLQGEHLQRAINGKYLKKYFPSVWQDA